MIFDPIYMILTLFVVGMMGIASSNVRRTFQKYSQIPVRSRMSNRQRHILDSRSASCHTERVQEISRSLRSTQQGAGWRSRCMTAIPFHGGGSRS